MTCSSIDNKKMHIKFYAYGQKQWKEIFFYEIKMRKKERKNDGKQESISSVCIGEKAPATLNKFQLKKTKKKMLAKYITKTRIHLERKIPKNNFCNFEHFLLLCIDLSTTNLELHQKYSVKN